MRAMTEERIDDLVTLLNHSYLEKAASYLAGVTFHHEQAKSRRSCLGRLLSSTILGVAMAVALLFSAWLIFRRIKSRSRNERRADRFQFIDEVSYNVSQSTDITKASLDELEAALLKAENELDQLEQSKIEE